MKFSIAATSMLVAVATQHASAFTPSPSFGVANKQLNNLHHQRKLRTSKLHVLSEDMSSTVGEIQEGAGKTFTPNPNRKTFATPSAAAADYLSNYEGQSGASIIYSKLVEHGVDVVNGYSGGAVLPLLDQFHEEHPRHAHLEKPPIRWITNSNENSAGHIAEGYAKSAPKMPDGKQPAGVVVATSGPGVTNLITPLQDAICDGVPMVVLCGQAATTAPADAFQAAPAVDLTRPCTKWSYQIKSAAELPYVMDYAFFIARNGRPGPVFVDLPKDLQNQILTGEAITEFANSVPVRTGNDDSDGIVRFMPSQQHLHVGLPDKGIVFQMNDENTGMEPVLDGQYVDGNDEVKFQFDHNPANVVYAKDTDTGDLTEGELQANTKLMGKMYNLIKKAKKPIIIAGQGCNECPEELKWFAEAMHIPVTTTLHGLGCFDERHHLALNMVGMHGHPTPNFMTQEADLIICVGSRFDDRITGQMGAYIPAAKKAAEEYRGGVIHVDIRLSQKASQVEPTFFVHSTGKKFFETINAEIRNRREKDPFEAGVNTGAWLQHKNALQEEFPVKVPFFPSETVSPQGANGSSDLKFTRTRMSAQSVVSEMDKQILAAGKMDDCVFSTGVGIHQMVTAQLITWTQPKQMVSSGSLGTMGVALGFVIGCKLANGHKMCIAVDGDGSFNMTFTELKTVAEQNIPVKILILDNESQMMVEYWQRLFHDERYLAVTNTVNPDYGKLAESFGIKNLYVDSQEDLPDVMRQFLFEDPDKPVLMHARIERTPCLPLVAPGAPLQDMILEDLETDYGFDASAAPS